jgi:hypothetical protein
VSETKRKKKAYGISVYLIVLFCLFSLLNGFAKGDLQSSYNFVLLGVSVLVISHYKLTISTKYINILYLLSFLWCIILTVNGINRYGFIPGNSPASYLGLGFRISLFPESVVGSAIFSLIVFLVNIFSQKKNINIVVLIIAIYFIAFSANRSVMICLMFLLMLLIIKQYAIFSNIVLYNFLIIIFFIITILLVGLMPAIAEKGGFNDSVVGSILFRNQIDDYANGDIDRISIWSSHLSAFIKSPIIGTLPKDINIVHGGNIATMGSESFLTNILAKNGFATIFLLLFFSLQIKRTLQEHNIQGYAKLMMIAVLSISYGSFMVPYSFLFLILISIDSSDIEKNIKIKAD